MADKKIKAPLPPPAHEKTIIRIQTDLNDYHAAMKDGVALLTVNGNPADPKTVQQLEDYGKHVGLIKPQKDNGPLTIPPELIENLHRHAVVSGIQADLNRYHQNRYTAGIEKEITPPLTVNGELGELNSPTAKQWADYKKSVDNGELTPGFLTKGLGLSEQDIQPFLQPVKDEDGKPARAENGSLLVHLDQNNPDPALIKLVQGKLGILQTGSMTKEEIRAIKTARIGPGVTPEFVNKLHEDADFAERQALAKKALDATWVKGVTHSPTDADHTPAPAPTPAPTKTDLGKLPKVESKSGL